MRENLTLTQLDIDLYNAVEYGNPTWVIAAINAGADVDAQTSRGDTPAILACKTGHLQAFDMLVYYGADLSIKNQKGETVSTILQAAIEKEYSVDSKEYYASRLRKTKEVLENPRSKNQPKLWDDITQFRLGESLIEAVRNNDFEKIKSLVDQGANVLHMNEEGDDPLVVANKLKNEKMEDYLSDKINLSQYLIGAIYDCDISRAKRMLEKGAHPMAYDRYGNLGILLAAERGLFPLVRKMISLGVDPNVTDKYHNTLLKFAVKNSDSNMVDYLFEKGFDYSRHYHSVMDDIKRDAVASKNLYIVQQLITTGTEADKFVGDAIQTKSDLIMDYLFSLGALAQHHQQYVYPRIVSVIQTGNPDIVKRAIDKGLFVDKPNRYGQWALLEAVKTKNEEILKMLLDKKPLVDRTNEQGWTALMEACKLGYQNMAKMLIESGADVNKQDVRGWTPLMVAAESGSYQTAGELYVAGAEINKQSNTGRTALSIAMDNRQVDMARHILFWGAKESIALPSGKDLIFQALELKHNNLLNELVVNGADVNVLDNNEDNTPLLYALRHDNVEQVKYFLEKGADPFLENKYTLSAYKYAVGVQRSEEYEGHFDPVKKEMSDLVLAFAQKRQAEPVVIQKAKRVAPLDKDNQHLPE